MRPGYNRESVVMDAVSKEAVVMDRASRVTVVIDKKVVIMMRLTGKQW